MIIITDFMAHATKALQICRYRVINDVQSLELNHMDFATKKMAKNVK